MAERTQTNHVSIKLGESEFNLAGPDEATLLALARQWLDSVHARTNPTSSAVPSVPGDIVSRAFTIAGTTLILNLWPVRSKSPADVLFMLLWGFRGLKEMDAVPAGALTDAARASGDKLTRIDRVLEPYKGLYKRTGTRKGTKYALTNSGLAYAARLLLEGFK